MNELRDLSQRRVTGPQTIFRATGEEVRAHRGQPEGQKGLQVSGKDVTLELAPQVRGPQGWKEQRGQRRRRGTVHGSGAMSVCKSGGASFLK